MNTSQINNQFIINIKPEVIISCEFEDNIMSPCILSVRCLGEISLQFHCIIIIRFCSNSIQFFILPRIIIRKKSCIYFTYNCV